LSGDQNEAIRHKYIDESECSPTWLAEAKKVVKAQPFLKKRFGSVRRFSGRSIPTRHDSVALDQGVNS
jgi:hypothetical protein